MILIVYLRKYTAYLGCCDSHRIFKQPEKALISLHVCAGWSEPLLVAHTKLLEISCHGSNGITVSNFTEIFIGLKRVEASVFQDVA